MRDDQERERMNKNIVQLPLPVRQKGLKRGYSREKGKEKEGRKEKKRGDHAPLHPL